MIKNVIFDFGQVLVHFIPNYMTKAYIENESDVRLTEEVIFDRLYWDKLDAGTITDDEVVELIKERLPERLWQNAEKAFRNWIYNIPQIEGMEENVIKLKEKGINICILSNISKGFAERYEEIPILKHFDKFVFSSTCGMVKPNKDIFEHVLNKYNFKAEETLFIDDRKENIEGALSVGINGYLFDGNAEKFSKFIEETIR